MKKTFKITQFESRTLSWWYNRKNKIDMNPPYQRRGRLWSNTDKAYLIDSILNGYDIPKIYIADFTWGDSDLNINKLPYAIIDGKQRFEAIFDFFDGKIVLNDDFVFLEKPDLKLGGLGYKDLISRYQDVAEEFQNYNLSVISVYAVCDKTINELFVRLNRSKPLTGAEVRNAMAGPAPKIIRQIAKHEYFDTYIRFNINRGQDLNASAKILLFEFYGAFRETTKKNLDIFVKEMEKKNANKYRLELSGHHVIEILNDMCSIFLPKDKLLNSAGTIPVYYWLIRKFGEKYYPFIREFLNEFEQKRKLNRELIRKDPTSKNIEAILVEYDNYNRSTNNQQSHEERFRILKDRFMSFYKSI